MKNPIIIDTSRFGPWMSAYERAVAIGSIEDTDGFKAMMQIAVDQLEAFEDAARDPKVIMAGLNVYNAGAAQAQVQFIEAVETSRQRIATLSSEGEIEERA